VSHPLNFLVSLGPAVCSKDLVAENRRRETFKALLEPWLSFAGGLRSCWPSSRRHYPVPDDRIDLIRYVLKPAGVRPKRRTTELTIAVMQLVASRRGLAALPSWAISNYLRYGYVIGRRIGKKGLWSNLYGVTTVEVAHQPSFATSWIRHVGNASPS